MKKTNITREWNGKHNIIEWQCEHELYIKRSLTDTSANKYLKPTIEDGNDIISIINNNEYWRQLNNYQQLNKH
jgi:hypothetical protein